MIFIYLENQIHTFLLKDSSFTKCSRSCFHYRTQYLPAFIVFHKNKDEAAITESSRIKTSLDRIDSILRAQGSIQVDT